MHLIRTFASGTRDSYFVDNMRETNFIKQNETKWKDFEEQIKQNKKDPDKLNNLFIQVLDDLSYSRTFYRFRSVRVYLNNLAQELFLNIYKNKRSRFSKFVNFFKEELPAQIYRSRKEFLVSFFVFIAAVIIGVVSTKHDPEFAKIILGSDYVAETENNIAKGDPMGIYKNEEEMGMFFSIALNNLKVSVIIFLLGMFFSAGTISVMVYHGIMVGTFQYFFYQKGLFIDSFLTIWLHGTLEMSCMVIAGAAGITMGNGLVFPGTYTRLQSFMLSSRRGVKIMLGIAPIIIFAAFIESFVTRYTELPTIIRASLIAVSLFFILGYFVFYARKKGLQLTAKKFIDTRLPPNPVRLIKMDEVKDNSELLKDSLAVFTRILKKVAGFSAIMGIAYAVIAYFLFHFLYTPSYSEMDDQNEFYNVWLQIIKAVFSNSFSGLGDMFNYRASRAIIILNITMMTLLFSFVYKHWKMELLPNKEKFFSGFTLKIFVKAFTVSFIINVAYMIGLDNGFILFLFWIIIPVLLFWAAVAYEDTEPFYSSIIRMITLLRAVFSQFLGLFLVLFILCILSFLLVNSPLMWLYFELMQVGFELDSDSMNTVIFGFSIAASAFSFCILLPIIFIGMLFMYHNASEVLTAASLKKRIGSIGEQGKQQ